MRIVSMPLAVLLVLSACVMVQGQAPPPGPHDQPPPPRGEARDAFGGRGDGHRQRGAWGRGGQISEQQAAEALAVLRRIDPEKADELEKAIEHNHGQIAAVLHEHFPRIGRFMAWKKHDPEGFELRIQDLALSRQTHDCAGRLREALDAGDDELAAIEELELGNLVAEHFDVRQKIREHELAKLQSRIEQLVDQLEERATNREALIEERIESLLSEGSRERW